MHYAWNLLLFIWAAATIRLSSGACPTETIGMQGINDTWDNSIPLPGTGLLTGTILDEVSFDIGENGIDYMEVFRPEIVRPDASTYEVLFFPGSLYHDYVDLFPRNKSTRVIFRYTCDNAERTSQVLASWDDINTRAPEFVPLDPSKLTFSIGTNWDKRIPLNWKVPILISDKDHDFANTQSIILTSTPDILRLEHTHLYQDGDTIPSEYLTDVKVFIKDEYDLVVGDFPVEVTVSDGIQPASSPITITVKVDSPDNTSPVFTDTKYRHKMTSWPIADEPYVLDQPIEVSIPGDDTAEFDYTFSPVDYIRFEDPDNPRSIIFTRNGSPDDGNFVIVDVTATKRGTELKSAVPLIIEFPPMPKPKFSSNEFPQNVEWNENGVPQEIVINGATELNPLGEVPAFIIGSIYPSELSGRIQIDDRGNNNIYLTLTDITEELAIKNHVAFVQIVAQLGEDQFERTAAVTVALYFPEKEDPTTEPTQTTTACPTVATEVTTSCPPCDCSTTPAEGTTPCEPTTCPTTSESCPTCPPPTTCPVTEEPGTTCPTTSETCPPPITCPTTSETCPPPITCPVTEDPGTTCPTRSESCPTCPPPTTCPVTEEPGTTCPTTSETCPPLITCPTTSETCPPPITCPTTSETCPPPITCPTTCPPPITCPTTSGTCPTCPPPTTCPVTEEPGTTCPTTCPPPVTCPTTSGTSPTCPPPTTCAVNTCPQCPSTPPPTTPCPLECPTTTQCPERTTGNSNCPDCEADSNTGLVAGIIAVSVLFAISLAGAGFLFWKLKSAATSSFPSSFGGDPAPPKARHSFAQPGSMRGGGDAVLGEDDGWVNPAFSGDPVSPNATAGTLEQVLTHPAPSTSAAAFSPPPVTPYMTSPLVSDPPMKSSLAKPKEIAPDYEEGLGKSPEDPNPASKPKSGGVKIADEVEIINHDEGESERL